MGEERKTGKTHTTSEGAGDKNKEKEEGGEKDKIDGCVLRTGGWGGLMRTNVKESEGGWGVEVA